jgi:multiple sugar transport system permease protein
LPLTLRVWGAKSPARATDPSTPHARLEQPRRRRRADFGVAVCFLLPSFCGLSAFLILPLLASLLLSFSNWRVIGNPRFIGLDNYIALFARDPIFWEICGNTLLYTAEYLALNLVISITMAVWICRLSWGRRLFRLIFFLPVFTPLVGSALVWLLMLMPGGLLENVSTLAQIPIPNLITNSALAIQAVIIVSLWSHFGYNLLLFSAALESIERSYLDAAAVDGANGWQRFWRIKMPLISPALFFGTVLTAINSLQVFDQVYALTRGGPGAASSTLGYAIYTQGFVTYRLGYASAIAWVLFTIIMLLTALQLRLQRHWVHYDL